MICGFNLSYLILCDPTSPNVDSSAAENSPNTPSGGTNELGAESHIWHEHVVGLGLLMQFVDNKNNIVYQQT